MERFSLKRDWSEIPGHLLANVLERLIVADDYVKFGAVCVSWRTVFAEELGMMKMKKKHRHLLPFLLIPPHKEEKDGNTKSRSLYNLSNRRVCDFEVQLPHSKWCRGSCFGWLVNLEIDYYSNHYSVQLQNPFLSNNHTIDLPPLDNFEVINEQLAKQPLCLKKAVLSANPTLADDYVVMAIMGDFGRLAFFKPGNKDWNWIPIDSNQLVHITDILYFSKTQKFYAVDDLGAVFAIDLQGEDEEGCSDHLIPKLTQVAPSAQNNWVSKRYLVESLSGDLLQVFKSVGLGYHGSWFSRFQVFKLDLTIGEEWIQIHSLGDAILFLGENSSFSLSASDIPGCKPNCIYFTEDCNTDKHKGRYYGPQDAAIFNLEDGTIQPHYPMESRNIFPLPIWIEPTIQKGNFQPYV